MDIKREYDCCDPWFTHIKEKRKVVEGRLCSEKYTCLNVGDIIKLKNITSTTNFQIDAENITEHIFVKITNLVKYKTFKEMIETETLEKILPDESVGTIDDGVSVYYKFYSKSLENKYGVLAIHIELLN